MLSDCPSSEVSFEIPDTPEKSDRKVKKKNSSMFVPSKGARSKKKKKEVILEENEDAEESVKGMSSKNVAKRVGDTLGSISENDSVSVSEDGKKEKNKIVQN